MTVCHTSVAVCHTSVSGSRDFSLLTGSVTVSFRPIPFKSKHRNKKVAKRLKHTSPKGLNCLLTRVFKRLNNAFVLRTFLSRSIEL